MNENLKNKIESILNNNEIVLFMKGDSDFPMCGFSRQVVLILKDLNIDFKDINILEDNELREGLKIYSNWPTFPQLYVNKELIGGCDIITELYENNQLKKLIYSKLNKK